MHSPKKGKENKSIALGPCKKSYVVFFFYRGCLTAATPPCDGSPLHNSPPAVQLPEDRADCHALGDWPDRCGGVEGTNSGRAERCCARHG